jgi:RNA polymerase sigma-70 factor (ECF subfamily)
MEKAPGQPSRILTGDQEPAKEGKLPSPGTKKDLELIRRFQAGDEEAFKELYERHKGGVMSRVRYFSRDEEEIKSLTQDIFLKVHRKINSYVPNYAFTTWLYKIALNTCRDFYRGKQTKRRPHIDPFPGTPDADIFETLPVDPVNPETGLISEEDEAAIQKLFAQLTSAHQEIINLRLDGKPYEEIAKILDLPLGTVKARIHRAREQLAQLITKQAPSLLPYIKWFVDKGESDSPEE